MSSKIKIGEASMKTSFRTHLALASAAAMLTCLLFLFGSRGAAYVQIVRDPRAPFVLVLPDVGQTITQPEAHIPTAELRTIKFLIRKPFSDSISPGKVYVSINGEAAGTAVGVNPGLEGHVATCDLERKPRLKLHSGKNVVEVSAQDQQRNWYYASYVLLAGGQRMDDPAIASGASIEYVVVRKDREPPEIILTEPKGAVRSITLGVTIPVRGLVIDSSGLGVSVKINGQPAAVSRTGAVRGLSVQSGAGSERSATVTFAFEGKATLSGAKSSLIVEAKDGLGNLTRVSIPMRGRVAAVSSEFKGRKFAVIIGVSKYQRHEGGLGDLEYADADARSMRDFLRRPEGGGFARDDILYLENENATLGAVRDGLYRFLPKAGPNDLIIVFLAGHGSPDPYSPRDLYFLMHDTRVADMPHTALPMKELQDALDGIVRAQRTVVFIDACHAAGLSGEKMAATRGLENNLINLYASKLFKETGRAVLTSSDVNELSQESQNWGGGHGIFTLALLDGLRGEADANGDAFVTAGELFAYVRDRVRTETGFHQNPYALPGLNANLTLAVASK